MRRLLLVAALVCLSNTGCILNQYSSDPNERMEQMLKTMATVDELTGLYNRRGFMELTEKLMAVARREQTQSVLFFFDMDNLKKVNDSLGHDYGDRALIEINEVLRYTFRESDIIARVGGDEFAVFSLENIADSGRSAMERLQKNIDARNGQHNRPYQLSLSMGAMACPVGDECALDALMKQADQQMYEQKLRKKQKNPAS